MMLSEAPLRPVVSECPGPVAGPEARGLGALVLTRHVDESIMIGDEVEVRVVGIRPGKVRLRIVAPRSIAVHRLEVFEAIRSAPVAADRAAGAARSDVPQGGLVLTRSPGQSIMVGVEVELSVVEIRPATVKLKVVAPRALAVHRREVFDAIRGDRA